MGAVRHLFPLEFKRTYANRTNTLHISKTSPVLRYCVTTAQSKLSNPSLNNPTSQTLQLILQTLHRLLEARPLIILDPQVLLGDGAQPPPISELLAKHKLIRQFLSRRAPHASEVLDTDLQIRRLAPGDLAVDLEHLAKAEHFGRDVDGLAFGEFGLGDDLAHPDPGGYVDVA